MYSEIFENDCPPKSVRETVNQVVHSELVGLVGLIERPEAAAGPLPVLGDVRVVVDDRHQPLAAIVVLEDPLEDRIAHESMRDAARASSLRATARTGCGRR